jgi:hypothetical protein
MPLSVPKGMQSSAYQGSNEEAGRLQGLFLRQASHCRYEVLKGPAKTLRWGVPPSLRDPLTGDLLHDDLLVSAALCALLDEQEWSWGLCPSVIIPPVSRFKKVV